MSYQPCLDCFMFETGIAAKVINIDPSAGCTFKLFFNVSHHLPRCSFTSPGYNHDILSIDHDACRHLIHLIANFCSYQFLSKDLQPAGRFLAGLFL